MRALIVGLVLALPGCAGTFEEARIARPVGVSSAPIVDRARCRELDDRSTLWGAIATGSAVVAGGAGLSTIPVESRDGKIGLAIGAALTAVVGGISVYVSDRASKAWVREGCAP